jgi:hypothetical protein
LSTFVGGFGQFIASEFMRNDLNAGVQRRSRHRDVAKIAVPNLLDISVEPGPGGSVAPEDRTPNRMPWAISGEWW